MTAYGIFDGVARIFPCNGSFPRKTKVSLEALKGHAG